MMKSFAAACLLLLFSGNAAAQTDYGVFRPVSFICREGATGTSVKIEENVLGNRKRYEVSYFDGKPTLFVISKSRNGRVFKRVALIDVRSERDFQAIQAAKYLAHVMAQDAGLYCHASRRQVLAARYALQANHLFNRSHPKYDGK